MFPQAKQVMVRFEVAIVGLEWRGAATRIANRQKPPYIDSRAFVCAVGILATLLAARFH